MKKEEIKDETVVKEALCTTLIGFLTDFPCMAQDSTSINQVEQKTSKVGGVKSLEDRIKQLEDAIKREPEIDKCYDRIQISGLIEVEGNYGKTDFKDPAVDDEKTSDVDLATVELIVNAKIAEHVDGHVMFK